MADNPPLWWFDLSEVAAESKKHHFSDLDQLQAFIAMNLMAIAAAQHQDDDDTQHLNN